MRLRLWLLAGVALALFPASCGGRSGLQPGTLSGSSGSGSGGAPIGCNFDSECGETNACVRSSCEAGACKVELANCDDGDLCSEDACDAALGCVHRPLTFDLDGDGFNAPQPGFTAGQPGACGEDCNDQSARSFPGNREVCDGVDNDCNGVIDDGAVYGVRRQPVRVSGSEYLNARRGGLVATGETFALTYTAEQDVPRQGGNPDLALLRGITPEGEKLFETLISDLNASSFAGPLSWSGNVLALTWNDARNGDYNIFYRTFDALGDKLGPERQVTYGQYFSLTPNLSFNRTEFLVFWDDRREESRVVGDRAQIYAQRLATDGTLLGGHMLIVDGPLTENPVVAYAGDRLGLAYTSVIGGVSRLGFDVLDPTLQRLGTLADVFPNAESPTVHVVGDRFVVSWVLNKPGMWGDDVWAAVLDTQGSVVIPPRPVTSGGKFARYHHEVSLGDRLLMVWGDQREGNYELYLQILAADLSLLEPPQRLTFTTAQSTSPLLAAGPGGTIGVLYNDANGGANGVYFMTLECAAR